MKKDIVVIGKCKGKVVVIDCPYCGKTHTHGCPNGKTVGHRIAHCSDSPDKGYFIKVIR